MSNMVIGPSLIGTSCRAFELVLHGGRTSRIRTSLYYSIATSMC